MKLNDLGKGIATLGLCAMGAFIVHSTKLISGVVIPIVICIIVIWLT